MSTATTYIDEMLDPLADAFTPEVARKLAALRPSPAEAARMEELAEKASEDRLTPPERAEYQARISVGDVISILRLKAQKYLQEQCR
jgi:hypothetical protein